MEEQEAPFLDKEQFYQDIHSQVIALEGSDVRVKSLFRDDWFNHVSLQHLETLELKYNATLEYIYSFNLHHVDRFNVEFKDTAINIQPLEHETRPLFSQKDSVMITSHGISLFEAGTETLVLWNDIQYYFMRVTVFYDDSMRIDNGSMSRAYELFIGYKDKQGNTKWIMLGDFVYFITSVSVEFILDYMLPLSTYNQLDTVVVKDSLKN